MDNCLQRGDRVFSNRVSLVCQQHSGVAPCPGVIGQRQLTPCVGGCSFVSEGCFSLCFAVFVCVFLSRCVFILIFIFCFILKRVFCVCGERKHEVGWVGRNRGEFGKGENVNKMYF